MWLNATELLLFADTYSISTSEVKLIRQLMICFGRRNFPLSSSIPIITWWGFPQKIALFTSAQTWDPITASILAFSIIPTRPFWSSSCISAELNLQQPSLAVALTLKFPVLPQNLWSNPTYGGCSTEMTQRLCSALHTKVTCSAPCWSSHTEFFNSLLRVFITQPMVC